MDVRFFFCNLPSFQIQQTCILGWFHTLNFFYYVCELLFIHCVSVLPCDWQFRFQAFMLPLVSFPLKLDTHLATVFVAEVRSDILECKLVTHRCFDEQFCCMSLMLFALWNRCWDSANAWQKLCEKYKAKCGAPHFLSVRASVFMAAVFLQCLISNQRYYKTSVDKWHFLWLSQNSVALVLFPFLLFVDIL